MSGASEIDRRRGQLENYFQTHSDSTAAIILAAGFLVRIWVASATFLDPDEALHFWAANRTSLGAAYQGSLHLSHPPLLVFVLYFWRWLGTSEVVLRLPSVIAGTGFCWVAFKWLTGLFGRLVGWIGLIFLTFLPPMIALSSEVRQYALLLLFIAGAAYLLERALADNSAKYMAGSLLCLYLAMLSHYSAFLFAAAIGGYAILRMATQRVAFNVIGTWVVGQAVGMGIAVFLYITHLSRLEKLQGGQASEWQPSAYLPSSYFHPGHGNPLWWALARTGSIFQYLFGQRVVGDLAYPLFIIGVVILLRRKFPRGKFGADPRLLGILLVLPFVLTCAAALAGKYPYGGTRHSAFLAMFAVAGVSALLAKIIGQRMVRGIALAILVVAGCSTFAWRHQPYMRADQSQAHMDEAIQFMQQQISPSDAIFVDNQTSMLLGHYLCRQKPFDFDRSIPEFRSFQCGGYRIVSTSGEDFWFTVDSFSRRWNEMIPKYGLRPDQTVWIIQAGQNVNLAQELRTKFPEFRDLKAQSFGRNISIFKLTVGQPMPQVALSF